MPFLFSRRRFLATSSTLFAVLRDTTRLRADAQAPDKDLEKIRLLADKFVEWQNPFGKPDPSRCPFVTNGSLISPTHLHSPTFMAIGLYRAFDVTNDTAYRDAADRYLTFYFSCLRNPPSNGHDSHSDAFIKSLSKGAQSNPHLAKVVVHLLSRPWMYGMGLAAYREFKRRHPGETFLDSKAAAVYDWLMTFRWQQGSYFRNGYGEPALGVEDCANSDDNAHIGRGLIGYYQVSKRPEVLTEVRGLARYYLTEVKPGAYQGCWSSALGTWVVAPTDVSHFEHFEGKKASEMGWGFSSVGTIEFLSQLAGEGASDDLRSRIADKCVSSMKWQFDACQFPDGACGMHAQDDKWLGMTAGAILSFLRCRDAGFLSEAVQTRYRTKAVAARDWLLSHCNTDNVRAGGYLRITGKSKPRPLENLVWLLGWTIEALVRIRQI